MIEKSEITKKLIKNVLINFIVFTVILVTFDFIIYNNTVSSLYKEVDVQLEEAIKKKNLPEKEIARDKVIDKNIDIGRETINPRLIVIERDKSGNILNEGELGLLNDYIEEISFNPNNLNSIYNIQINNEYAYRGINYKMTQNEETVYIQVLVNVDGEARNISKFSKNIVLWYSYFRYCINSIKFHISKKST